MAFHPNLQHEGIQFPRASGGSGMGGDCELRASQNARAYIRCQFNSRICVHEQWVQECAEGGEGSLDTFTEF